MATVPVTRTWVSGEVVTAAYMNNNLTAVLAWLLAPAICQVRQLVSQSVPNNTATVITFTGEDVDTTGMHSTSVNTSRLTAVYPGWYKADGAPAWAANATGRRLGGWKVNGSDVNASYGGQQTTASGVCVSAARGILVFLNVGDYLEMIGRQESGGALSTTVGAGVDQSHALVIWTSN